MASSQRSHSGLQHSTIRFSWRCKRTEATLWKKPRIWLLYEIKCSHAPTWPSTPSLWLYLLDKTSLVQVSRPRYNWPWYLSSSSRGCIRRKIKATFHEIHVIFSVIKESPPWLQLGRCPSASTNQRVFQLATWTYWARPSSAQFMRKSFLLETKVFVASSYRHDKEDVACPSKPQTEVVARPHLRVSQNG